MNKALPIFTAFVILLILAAPVSAQRQGNQGAQGNAVEAVSAQQGDLVQEKVQLQLHSPTLEQVNALKQQLNNQGENTQIQMQNTRAITSQGATFTLDEVTNQVTITTPSGQEQVLNHLPDQAIERMIEAGVIESSAEATLLEVEPTAEGVFYKTRSYQSKRFLGIFPRRVAQEVSLNDETGEVFTQDVISTSLVDKILNLLTF